MATVSPQFIIEGLKRRGYPEHVAQGFVMNMMDESGLNPGINEAAPIVPGSRGGFGLYQLTGPRRTAYEQFAAQRGVNPADAEAQLDFLDYELKGPESRAAKSILSTQNPQQAAVAIARDFLRPATEHLQNRVARYTGADVAADTMAALGKGGGTVTPDQIAQGAMAQSAGQEPEQPRGLLGNLFGNPDTMAALAMAFNSMRLNPDPNLSAVLSAQMKERRGERKATAQQNRTLDYLRSLNTPQAAEAIRYAEGTGDIAGALKMATATGKDERTALIKNFEFAKSQGFKGSFQDFMKAGGGGGSVVNINGEDYKVVGDQVIVPDPSSPIGIRFVPIPGGKTAAGMERAGEAQEARTAGEATSGATVLEDITRAKEIAKNSPLLSTGFIGGILRGVGGTSAKTLDQLTTTIKSNIGFDRLQRMRDESPTGGALGQVAVQELEALQSSLGSLDTSLNDEELIKNLTRLENQYRRSMQRILNTEGGAKYFTPREIEMINGSTQAESQSASMGGDGSMANPFKVTPQTKPIDIPSGAYFTDPNGILRRKP